MSPKETIKQINDLTCALVGLSLSDEQNFPSTSGDIAGDFEITVNTAMQMSVALKNIEYREIYAILNEKRCYNFKMLDGALVSLRYRFKAGNVSEHSLCYFPSPDLEHFQNDPELYLTDEIYAEVVAKNIVSFPLRFDFSNDPLKFVDIHHPYCHLTLGQYENCRIPVCSPMSPLIFGGFILRNFYNTAARKYSKDIPTRSEEIFPNTITVAEKSIPHIRCNA